jgi:hypothetical protein
MSIWMDVMRGQYDRIIRSRHASESPGLPGRPPTGVRPGRDEEHRPPAECHLNFPEQVQRLRAQTQRRRQAACTRLLIVSVPHPV